MTDESLCIKVGVLDQKIHSITDLCIKMDKVIEKLSDQHDRHIAKVYDDIEIRRKETDMDIKELHERIDDVLDKVQGTEKSLLSAIQELRKEMQSHNAKEKETLDKILQWKWTIFGVLLTLSWVLSKVSFSAILPLLK